MIPTTDKSRVMNEQIREHKTVRTHLRLARLSVFGKTASSYMRQLLNFRALQWVSILLMSVLMASCTNSKLVISPLYNRLDDRMKDQFNELGDFTDEQTKAFEQSLGTFHVWHRQSELPQYAMLIRSLASSIAAADTTDADIQQWMDTVEMHSRAARDCHPVNFSIDLIKSLSDDQLTSIEKKFDEEHEEDVARYESRTPEERIERRINNVTKWSGRVGLDLTPAQRAMLLSTFKQQISLRQEYFSLSAEWNDKLFELARAKDNPVYEQDLLTHLSLMWGQLDAEHPQELQANRDLWKKTAHRFLQSMTSQQRETVSQWMSKLGSTLAAIAKDEPSFQVAGDPSKGCLVDPEKT
ncbi:MAG: DUF6279 family lipoprotein [Granulosicoccus sp.]